MNPDRPSAGTRRVEVRCVDGFVCWRGDDAKLAHERRADYDGAWRSCRHRVIEITETITTTERDITDEDCTDAP